jgi:glycosyltransferase involved in cell wall biosynthesis
MPVHCRVLYLVGQLGTGGLERQLYYLVQAMDRERYRPAVIVWNFCPADTYVSKLRELGVPLFALSRSSRMGKLHELRALVRTLRPEVVHSYSFFTNFAASYSTLGTNAIAVGAVRSDLRWAKETSGPWVGRLSARYPRAQISNNVAAAKDARTSRSLFIPRNMFVVRNAVDLQLFAPVPYQNWDPVRIIALGSLTPVKRWDRVLDLAQALKQARLRFRIELVGNGPLREPLEREARASGVGDCVRFMGYSNEIPRLLGDAHFLVHTSESEGCPNAIMEAMACGRAVIAPDVGDLRGLVVDGETGFIIRPGGDATLLAERAAQLIADRDLCRRMGQRARIKAEREFGLQRFLGETLDVYRGFGWMDN